MDIKEMAAISHQDMDEAVVVHTILDGLHPWEKTAWYFVISDKTMQTWITCVCSPIIFGTVATVRFQILDFRQVRMQQQLKVTILCLCPVVLHSCAVTVIIWDSPARVAALDYPLDLLLFFKVICMSHD
jgi:hypothetical protein